MSLISSTFLLLALGFALDSSVSVLGRLDLFAGDYCLLLALLGFSAPGPIATASMCFLSWTEYLLREICRVLRVRIGALRVVSQAVALRASHGVSFALVIGTVQRLQKDVALF